MLTKLVTDARAWTAKAVDRPSAWYYALSETCLAAIDEAVERGRSMPVSEVKVSEETKAACAACLEPVREALYRGRGFAIVGRIPLAIYSVEEAQVAYWLVGQCLGIPFAQNIEGTLLYDVRDTGRDVKAGARFSVTNAESSFHTDGAFNDQVPEGVGLLCIQTARSGGRSQLISGYAVHNRLLEDNPDVLEALYEPFCFDRRGQFLPGEPSVKETPVFSWDGQGLFMRYLHYYIQEGHRATGVPLRASQTQALAAVEQILGCADLRVEFDLQPGQILFTNNNWILHNRTAFEDHVAPEKRRHYVRLWLLEGER